MLKVSGITETALYVDDLNRAIAFYMELFGCAVIRRDERFCALRIAEEQVLLLFRRGGSLQPNIFEGGVVPAHDGSGPLHVCFGMSKADVERWEEQLRSHGIGVESRVKWPNGAISLYFRDPDNHAVELATPGLWNS